ncbi:MAG: hypothetical protein FWF20_07105 [Betaproteobacteria bacterium]|nr:hypothetical protein [Betaproteobacteria bacterium]MCL2886537.1 hypothetical protein [Betaproteobacteria bacterium]
MPHLIGFVDDSTQLAHKALIAVIKQFASANGWQVMRDLTPSDGAHELILKGPGYSGTEEIFVGVKSYENVNTDYYNLAFMACVGYVAGNTFETQPGVRISGCPGHNKRIDYWISLSPQRIAGALKVGTPVYESFYVGKMFPYARPSQYPLPLVCASMLNGAAATRYSDTTHSMPYKGNRANCAMRFVDGLWQTPYCHPWGQTNAYSDSTRDTNGVYPLIPIELNSANGMFGCLEGISHISGFNNIVENTVTQGGQTHVVIQDVSRTGFADYYALRLDANP